MGPPRHAHTPRFLCEDNGRWIGFFVLDFEVGGRGRGLLFFIFFRQVGLSRMFEHKTPRGPYAFFPSLGGWCGGDIPILEPMETSLPTKVGERKKRKEKFRFPKVPRAHHHSFHYGSSRLQRNGEGMEPWNTRKGRQLSVFPQINRPWVFSPPNALLSQ